jgi:hypothetical protein
LNKNLISFKAKHHEEDTYMIDNSKYGGVKVFQMMDSGTKRSFFLTREAMEELIKAYNESKGGN